MRDDGIIITTYAPVIITTLNRYEHLKRLLESIERNPLAEFTEVFISVDFPPSEKYTAGYEKIKTYLNNRDFGFKKTNLFFQDSNLGPSRNDDFLRDIVFEKYDRVIILEDDNEVSDNFLEYINKALEYGKNREDIMCVTAFSGYFVLPKGIRGTAFKSQVLTWGLGAWKGKEKYVRENISTEWVDDISRDWKKLYTIYKKNKVTFMNFCNYFVLSKYSGFYENGKVVVTDTIRTVYMILNDKYAILPVESKIRNYGCDGSGVNGKFNEEQMSFSQPLDTADRYSFILESDAKMCKMIQRYIRNKRKFACNEFAAIKTLLYCFYFINIKNKRSV